MRIYKPQKVSAVKGQAFHAGKRFVFIILGSRQCCLMVRNPFSVFAIFDKRLLSWSRTWSFVIHHPEVAFLVKLDATDDLIVLALVIEGSY